MSLDTLANVKTRIGLTTSADDALLDLLRASADEFVTQHCGRSFEAGTYTECFPGGRPVVRLRNFPVSSVTSVKFDLSGAFGPETALATTSYSLEAERGLLWSRGGRFPCGPNSLQVVYATSAAVPGDVMHAYADLVAHWYRHVKTMIASQYQDVTQQTFGVTTAIFAKDQIAGLPLPATLLRALAPYRQLPV